MKLLLSILAVLGLQEGSRLLDLRRSGLPGLCMRAAVSVYLILHHNTVRYDMVLAF